MNRLHVAFDARSAANRRKHNRLLGRKEQVVVSPDHLFQFIKSDLGVNTDTWEEQLEIKDKVVAKRLLSRNSATEILTVQEGTDPATHYRRWEIEKLLDRPASPAPDMRLVDYFRASRGINRITSSIVSPIIWDRVKHGIGISRRTALALVRQATEAREGTAGKPDVILVRAGLASVRGLNSVGQAVGDILVDHFADVFSASYDAKLKRWVDQIKDGHAKRKDVVAGYYDRITRAAESALRGDNDVKAGIPTGELCGKCGKPMLRKLSRFGVMQACSGYPDCRNVQPYKRRPSEGIAETCPRCSSQLQIKESWYGEFIGCSNYPLCDYKRKIA